jgi:hypothetical protein
MGNLIGEEISKTILKQIQDRQKMQGAGYNSESIKRDPKVLNYLNNRNAWIKMASGVAIEGDIGIQKLKDIFAQSPDQKITESEYANLQGTGLAKNLVLFNTIQSFNDNKYTPRSGVRNNNSLISSTNKMYGGLGGNSQGLQPVGGITDFTVESLNRGSIRKATVNIKVYNRFQFNLVEILYLRLGYIMILEWGWDKYVSDITTTPGTPPTVTVEQMGPTIIEKSWFTTDTFTQQSMLKKIEGLRKQTRGNYDAFFGKVSNFSWKVNKDGSFDITVDLITLGSVIESINVRKPAAQITTASIPYIQSQLAEKFKIEANNGEYDNSLVNNIGSNIISQWLGQTILDFPYTSDYFNLYASARSNVGIKADVPEPQRYFIRLGEFLQNLQQKVFKNVINGNSEEFKQLTIDTGEFENRCNYIINLIPLDPGICIFDFVFSEEFQKSSYFKTGFNNDQSKSNGSKVVSTKGTKPFVILGDNSNVVYGQLMNIYMNIDFLQKELDNNIDDEGNLSVFQYLEGICKGINRCTGGTTNLEVAVKDDNVIYLLEQNPIKGFDKLKPVKDTAPIEILGYNSKGESNFVKDFSFNTKITPKLMNMISAGAAAEGDAASIPFNNWNDGFKNRFEEKSEEVDEEEQQYTGTNSEFAKGENFSDSSEIILKFKQDMSTKGIGLERIDQDPNNNFWDDGDFNYDWEWQGTSIDDLGDNNTELTGDWLLDKENKKLLDEVVERVQKIQFLDSRSRFAKGRTIVDPDLASSSNLLEGIYTIPGEEYKSYIITAFGGDPFISTRNGSESSTRYNSIKIPKSKSLWYKSITDRDFISRGINSFKKYINDINLSEYKNSKVQSSLSGFIPVELDITLEGLSGMKIYNKISINQKFLPPAYPKALKFVIRGINHSIKNNLWETNIQTISTSITDQEPLNLPSSFNNISNPQGPIEVKGPIPPKDPNDKLKIIDKRTIANIAVDQSTYGNYQSIEWLVGELNINTQNTWKKFLNILNEKYPGYTLTINATYRSYQRSIELKRQNPNNSTPGFSSHNYAFAIDMNVTDPNGNTYTKGNRTPWVESGIPEVAKSLGMRWGGDFKNYVDCVHFDVTRVTDAARANAAKDNEGLPQSEWDTKNTNYV